jgi:5-methylthioadenosine/S-adenosylhomocysteine deaminase
VGLGTDGPASNDNLDLWEEVRLAPVLARALAQDSQALSTPDALALATRGGATALELATGSLEPGRAADFIRLDTDDAAFLPPGSAGALVPHLVWAASSRHVTDVWVGGRRVVQARRCLTIDAPEARRQVTARSWRVSFVSAPPTPPSGTPVVSGSARSDP